LRQIYPELILIDGGDFGEAAVGRNVWKTAELFKTMRDLRYDVIGLGERDLAPAFFETASQQGGKTLLLSGNLQPAAEIGAPPFRLIKRRSFKVGVVQAISSLLQQGKSLEPKDPVVFLQQQLDAMQKQKAEVMVVVYHGTAKEVTELQPNFPQVDLWLLSHGVYRPLDQIPATEGAIVVGPGDRGREVGLIIVKKQKKSSVRSATFAQIILDQRIPDSPKGKTIEEIFRVAAQTPAQPASNNQ
jgi:2',3'-cyclic-nucleotide 2'-phosphodiesterase (5'-nucleotidase family)